MRNLIVCCFMMMGLLTACNGGGGGGNGNSTITGTLKLSPSLLSIPSGAENNLTLSFTSSGVKQTITVTISSSNPNIVSVPKKSATCVISNSSGLSQTCEVLLDGISTGSAVITATASGYKSASAEINVVSSGSVIPGELVFLSPSINVQSGQSNKVILKLEHSSGVIDQEVIINQPENPMVATDGPNKTSRTSNYCLLSSPGFNTAQDECSITIWGGAIGTTYMTATAVGENASLYHPTSLNINVSRLPVTPSINFVGNSFRVVEPRTSDTFVLNGNAITKNTHVTFSIQSTNGSDMSGLSVTNSCDLTPLKTSCPVTAGMFGDNGGRYVITASADGIPSAQIYIEVDPVSIEGQLSMISKYPQTIVVGSGVSIPVGALLKNYTGRSFQINLDENNDALILSTPPGATNVNCFKKNNGNYSCSCTIPLANYGTPYGNCSVYASGLYAGNTVITASSPQNIGGTPFTNPVSVSENIQVLPSESSVYGKLDFASKVMNIVSNSVSTTMLSIVDSQHVNGLNVNFSSTNPDIKVSASDCDNLSTALKNSCNVSISSSANDGSAIITAKDAKGKSLSAKMLVSIGTNGSLVADPAKVVLFNPAPLPGGGVTQEVVVKLVNSQGMNNVPYNIYTEDRSIADISPGAVNLSSGGGISSEVKIHINPTILVGSTFIDIVPNDTTLGYPTLRIPVQTMTPSQQERHFSFVNKCHYPVWFALSGGAVSGKIHLPGECPPNNSTFVQSADGGAGLCFWNNPPQPEKGYKLNSYNSGTPDQTTVTLPTNSGLEVQWSGTLTARTGCDSNGSCDYSGSCPIVGNGDMSCKAGNGFNPPSTLGELTLDTAGLDYYDVTLITGISVPMSFGPTNQKGFGNNAVSPYDCGTPGSIVPQTVDANTLGAANWLTPTPPALSSTNTIPPQIYNIVDVEGVPSSCGPNNGYSCPSGLTCGHTVDSLRQGSSSLDYSQWTCGTLVAQASADGLYKLNPTSTNTLPFNFFNIDNTPGENGNGTNTMNFTNEKFFECPASNKDVSPPILGLDSAYQPKTPENGVQTCGYVNWNMTYQSPNFSAYSLANQAWVNQVLPTITWVKQTCPTCYTYPYDDPTSTFKCHNNASKLNSANATDYTVTFCPNN